MKATEYKWKTFKRSGLRQVKLESGEDLRHLKELDQKAWTVLAASSKGLRFDARTLELLDTNGDGRVQVPEVLAALDFLEAKGVNLDSLFQKDEADVGRLADLTEKLADLEKVEPSDTEKEALKAWEEAPAADAAILPLQEATADAEATLAAVEPVLDAFFLPPDDAPLVMEGPEATLPLKGNLNPKFADDIAAFVEKAVKPIIGEVEELKRTDYAKVKAAFAPYRAWLAAKPVMNANARAVLEDEERVVRYRMYLVEYLRCNMRVAEMPLLKVTTPQAIRRRVTHGFEKLNARLSEIYAVEGYDMLGMFQELCSRIIEAAPEAPVSRGPKPQPTVGNQYKAALAAIERIKIKKE